LFFVEFVTTPFEIDGDESKIRDIKDRPILRAAKHANADILITGDKGFLESIIIEPKIITASKFINI